MKFSPDASTLVLAPPSGPLLLYDVATKLTRPLSLRRGIQPGWIVADTLIAARYVSGVDPHEVWDLAVWLEAVAALQPYDGVQLDPRPFSIVLAGNGEWAAWDSRTSFTVTSFGVVQGALVALDTVTGAVACVAMDHSRILIYQRGGGLDDDGPLPVRVVDPEGLHSDPAHVIRLHDDILSWCDVSARWRIKDISEDGLETLPYVPQAQPVNVLRCPEFRIVVEAGERLVIRDRDSRMGHVVSTQGPFHNLEAQTLGGRTHRIAWTSTTGEGAPQVVDVDLATAVLEDVTLPVPVVVPEPHQPTIPVSVTINSPRWVAPYYGGHLTDSEMPNRAIWDADPVEAHGTAHMLFHPYSGDDERAFELVNGVRTQVRFWGWARYVALGGTRPVIACQWCAPEVPDGMLIAVRNGVEGTDQWTAKNRAEIQSARDLAMAREVPCLLYVDAPMASAFAQARIRELPPERVGEELILECQCYPVDRTKPLDLAADATIWRHGLQWAWMAFRAEGGRVAIARKCYVRSDDTIGYVEAAQVVIGELANMFSVFADNPFSGWRESGIYRPTRGLADNRWVLEPWMTALEIQSMAQPRPPKFLPRQPQPDPPIVTPKPRKKSWLAWE